MSLKPCPVTPTKPIERVETVIETQDANMKVRSAEALQYAGIERFRRQPVFQKSDALPKQDSFRFRNALCGQHGV